jgi:hypothetical protein
MPNEIKSTPGDMVAVTDQRRGRLTIHRHDETAAYLSAGYVGNSSGVTVFLDLESLDAIRDFCEAALIAAEGERGE